MYVDARDNYSETELKKQSKCLQAAQFDAPWSGRQARQARERQPSVAGLIYKWLCTLFHMEFLVVILQDLR